MEEDLLLSDCKKKVNSECDIIIDLRGSNSLFQNEKKKDGYFRIDPNDKIGLEKVLKGPLILKVNLKNLFL